ncbi:hypothetical protein BT67DRAFT_436427 [Trichocladium antarcticum]|uniref:Uncharacterized protein n=1 Tax=Trichocladium antarcticum TaxID=1450529 RepID=A0AAN6Z9Y4_9PEZI|nr:hypothetical protein BT67DRAFT_436427 [Trichocladium antarcticum]
MSPVYPGTAGLYESPPAPLSPVPSAAPSRTAVSSVDVVKTRIQLDPVAYNRGLLGGFRPVPDSAGALLTGAGPTFAGYFLQGAFKFGRYEFFKQQSVNPIVYDHARNNHIAVYCESSAAAEFFADNALRSLGATRIRLVSQPTFDTDPVSGFTDSCQRGLAHKSTVDYKADMNSIYVATSGGTYRN